MPAGRDPSDVAVIVPVTTIVGDTDEERIAQRARMARAALSFYGSTPNYAFIWDEAGFEGTTARIRTKQKAGDFAGDGGRDHRRSPRGVLHRGDLGRPRRRADRQVRRRRRPARALQRRPPSAERFERYGVVARTISDRTASSG